MYNDYDEKIKSEIIILSDLKNYHKKGYEYYSTWGMRRKIKDKNPNKSEEEIESEINDEIKNKMNLQKKENMKYYQIDDKKIKELEKLFSQIKLKINFDSNPRILRDGKFYTISQGCFNVYRDKFYNKLFEIKFEENSNISSAIELDNKDLVFFLFFLLIIYRLINEKYTLFQKIDENSLGYQMQMSYSGCMGYPKTYGALYIKEISGNRFISVSNYGFKIYALNDKNEYSIVLLERYHERIKKIYELDKDNFIFFSQIDCGDSLGGPAHNILILDKIKLKEISENEKKEKLTEKNYRRYKFGKADENIIKSLKYNCHYNEFFEFSSYGSFHYFRGEVILKNKYLLVGIDSDILLFDINLGKQLKRYKILTEGTGNLLKQDANIKKWNNNNDNEFIMNLDGNIILFRLDDENDLKIIANSYFKDIKNLIKLDKNNNIFYDNGIDENSGYYRFYRSFDDEEDNKSTSISIYY